MFVLHYKKYGDFCFVIVMGGKWASKYSEIQQKLYKLPQSAQQGY